MSGPLTNGGHELFAQALAKGVPQHEAWLKAGFKGGEAVACRAAKRADVRARVTELQQRAATRAEVTVADIARQLDEDRTFAVECKQPGAAVSASLGKAKVLGLIVERQEHTGKNGGPIEYRNLDEDEIDARLAALSERNAGRSSLAH